MKKSKKIGFKITLTIENKGIVKIDTYIDTRVLTNIGNFLNIEIKKFLVYNMFEKKEEIFMNWKKTIDYIQDKPININDNWYYHSMIKEDLELVKEILQNGLKSAHLRGEKRGGLYNGKYYISLNKRNEDPDSSFNQYAKHHDIRFIFDNINPIHAKFNFDIFFMFCNTIIPIRSSGWEDEYHAFGKVEPSKIVALEYSLHYMTKEGYRFDKEKLIYLKQVILCLKELKKDLPIYDYTSNKEYNKDKVLSLNL